jgi:[protein-PII] uridylyltransferase
MDVRAANIGGDDGVAVEVFTVEVPRRTWPDTARLRADLTAVLAGDLPINERLNEREILYQPTRRRAAAHLPASDVAVDNTASESATVLEIRAPDQVGLLHRITLALFEADLDVVSARVSTLGELVVDAFYVRESAGTKVSDSERLEAIKGAVWASLTP